MEPGLGGSSILDTPRKVTRPSDNKLRWRWDPKPFGDSSPNQNPEALGMFTYDLRYPGQIYQSETGLYYNYFRDYDPAVGRYIESDPIGLDAGMKTYAYVRGDPLGSERWVDTGCGSPTPGSTLKLAVT